MSNVRKTLSLAAILTPVLAGPSFAVGTVSEQAWDRTAACLTTPSAVDLAGGARCVENQMGGLLLDEAVRFMSEQGQAMFGENFHLTHRMSWAPLGSGLAGELDMVVPLAAVGAAGIDADVDTLHGSAFFLQNGITRWTDKHGARRNDMRLGTAFRFTLPSFAGGDVFGASTLLQQNAEWGHQRLVFGTDYAGRWGGAALHHYIPRTNWRSGRPGYEERAVGGTEFSLRFDVTSTVTLDSALGRWERDDAGRSAVDGRIGLGWRPHPYLRFDASTGVGHQADSGAFRLSLNVPFGGSSRKTPKWEGLGAFGVSDTRRDDDMWRPVENVGRIRTIERTMTSVQEGDVSMRFVQSSASSGDEIEVEVSLSAPASEDVRLTVRLAPGSGDNPAVPGEDYVDEPAIVTIREGTTSERVTFQLLHNPGLDTERTLSVDVTRAG